MRTRTPATPRLSARRRHRSVASAAVLLLLPGTLGGAAFVAAPAAHAASLAGKRAQAAQLDRDVSRLEDRLNDLQERYRGELVQLADLQSDVLHTQGKLDRAKADLGVSKRRLRTRALAIYRDGAGSTQIVDVAKAGSFADFFERLDTIERVGDQDADIVGRVRSLAERVAQQEQRLRATRDEQIDVVHRIATSKRRMRRVMEDKRARLGSVTAEIRTIMEQQRAAEAARLAAESRARAKVIVSGGTVTEGAMAGGGGAPAAVGGASVTAGGATTSTGGDQSTAGASTSTQSSTGTSTSSSTGGSSTQPSAPAAVPLPPASGSASGAAGIAMGKVGAPYVYGAAGPSSFDCSGLVVWAFAQAGRPGLPHSTYSLVAMGVEVPLGEAQVGDLVFTNNAGHMGIYVGGGSFVHAPRTGRTVAVESLGNYSITHIRRI
ncbi:MAG: hypothetical protein JWM86_2309 [Thermoleophilia bacterium]|nr:hypothetical protein [Thermoleophilia bacterium]